MGKIKTIKEENDRIKIIEEEEKKKETGKVLSGVWENGSAAEYERYSKREREIKKEN